MPEGLLSLLDNRAHPCEIAESAPGPVQLNTYHGDSFSLGVASQELKTQSIIFIALQSNVCYGQFLRPSIDRPGIFFSRYLLDDKWVGDFRTTPSRASDQLLPEEGRFFGVQDGARAIGLYAPRALDGFTCTSSAKTIFTWTERHLIDEIWSTTGQSTRCPQTSPPAPPPPSPAAACCARCVRSPPPIWAAARRSAWSL